MTARPPTSVARRRPGAAGYWIGGAVVLVGVGVAAAWFVVGLISITHTIDDFERVPAADGGSVTLDEGNHVIYEENGSSAAGVSFVDVTMTDPSGNQVPLRRYSNELSYDFGGHSGRAVLTFRAPESGDYEVSPVSTTSRARIAIGPSIGVSLVRTIAAPFVIGGLALLIGAIVLIVTAVRQNRAEKPTRSAPPPPSGPMPSPDL